MRFLEVILENSELKEAKIYNAAKKAAKNPETGITINNKSAYHVIRDCANITLHYLPHFVFGGYENPFLELSGKLTRSDILQFVFEVERNPFMKQLLNIIIGKANELNIPSVGNQNSFHDDFDSADPYGEYGNSYEQTTSPQIEPPKDIVEYLCKLFNVKGFFLEEEVK